MAQADIQTHAAPVAGWQQKRPQQTTLKALAAASSMSLTGILGAASQQLWQQGFFHSNTFRKRFRPLRAILTFVLIVVAFESRRQQLRLSSILIRLLGLLQRSLVSWQERLARLKRRNGGGYRALWAGRGGGKPFSGVFFWGGTGDEDGSGNTTLTTGDGEGKPFRRKVMLGDRGRARCSWMVRQQFLRHAYCDVTFVVEGRAFPAHRCWVAAFSMPLCAMFNSGMRESIESRITLRDTDAGAFELMLNFIYGGPVELTQDNIECVLELSVRFSVGMLVEQCCNFLASAVAVDTACAILILADKYDCHPLSRDTLLYVVTHLPHCWDAAKPHFARLPQALLLEILSHDGLTHGEMMVFNVAVYWLEEWRRSRPVEQDEIEKDEEALLVETVLGQVRFPHMPASSLVEEVEGHPIMQAEACQRFVLEAYRYQAVVPFPQQQYQQNHHQQQQQQQEEGVQKWRLLQLQSPQQELLRKYALEMGVRARPRLKLASGGGNKYLLLAAGSSRRSDSGSKSNTNQWPELEEEKWGEELLLPGEGGGMVGGRRERRSSNSSTNSSTNSSSSNNSSSSSNSNTPSTATMANHQSVRRVEEIEPQVAGCEGRGGMGGAKATTSYSLISTTITAKYDRRIEDEEEGSSCSNNKGDNGDCCTTTTTTTTTTSNNNDDNNNNDND